MTTTKTSKSSSLASIVIVVFLISIILGVLGCSRQRASFKDTEKNCHSADIRNVVLPLFSKYKYPSEENGTGNVMPFSEVPKEIKSLPVFSTLPAEERLVMTAWAGTNGNALMFVAGSGFGHWGLLVCKDPKDRQFDNMPAFSYWENGIYFYDGD
jgi:hypothetical protein